MAKYSRALDLGLRFSHLVLATFQFFAIMAGLSHIGVHWLVSGLLALVVAGIPGVGSAAGVYGAVTAWGWTLMRAFAVFIGPFLVLYAVAIVVTRWEDNLELADNL